MRRRGCSCTPNVLSHTLRRLVEAGKVAPGGDRRNRVYRLRA